ncbi:hypothetical protein CWE12_10670 [Aliidiomarina sedimenti]|uniref:Recombinase domain-containing protein n=1 Tax=Aliidiomarina sedimenti TaxID=1933879 RepID=A0ABY0BWQ2_9GAMM|nr:hypothetical protein [Aliidiomarina sedimenti]RUO28769.1 hypothetical protein CWE12_10670 [Aliidiomarina sedimenti]
MTRDEQLRRRDAALSAVKLIVSSSHQYSPPSYKQVAAALNAQQLKTTWGNEWTPQRLLRFLQRLGYSGLHGVKAELDGQVNKQG